MATRTPQRSASAGRRRTTANTRTRRFDRPTTRRKPQPSSSPLSALTGLLPTGSSSRKSTSKSRGGGKSKAGFAALAGAAGLAFKNRSKITSRFGGNKNTSGTPNQQF